MIDPILNLIFPNYCVVCGAEVTERKFGAACPACWDALCPVPSAVCAQCGTPEARSGLCGRCRSGEYAFDFARSMLVFDDRLRTIMHHLKYADRVSLARPIGRMLREFIRCEPFTGSVVIPIPLHRSRQRERGFNQTALIGQYLELPIRGSLLRRKRRTSSQTGLTRTQRRENLRHAFEVRGTPPETVILLDDVFTTGTTVSEAAKTLKRAGVLRVEVVTVGRVAQRMLPDSEDQAEATVVSEST